MTAVHLVLAMLLALGIGLCVAVVALILIDWKVSK